MWNHKINQIFISIVKNERISSSSKSHRVLLSKTRIFSPPLEDLRILLDGYLQILNNKSLDLERDGQKQETRTTTPSNPSQHMHKETVAQKSHWHKNWHKKKKKNSILLCNHLLLDFELAKKIKKYNTKYSRVVTHHSTDLALRSLACVIGRERAFSSRYGRIWLYTSNLFLIPSSSSKKSLTLQLLAHSIKLKKNRKGRKVSRQASTRSPILLPLSLSSLTSLSTTDTRLQLGPLSTNTRLQLGPHSSFWTSPPTHSLLQLWWTPPPKLNRAVSCHKAQKTGPHHNTLPINPHHHHKKNTLSQRIVGFLHQLPAREMF